MSEIHYLVLRMIWVAVDGIIAASAPADGVRLQSSRAKYTSAYVLRYGPFPERAK